MCTVRHLDEVTSSDRNQVVAIGNFDGVHKGHQALLDRAKALAAARGTRAGVLIFEPHPRAFFRPDADHFTITQLPRKLARLDEFGMNTSFVLPFDAHMANLEPDAFVRDILVNGIGVAHVVVGYDFFFGKARAGTPETLKAEGLAHGFGVDVVAPQAVDGEAFSSSAIRAKLASGDVAGAARDLGDWWEVTGPVVGGAQKGGPMGFPTANVVMPRGTALGHGIFACRVLVDGQSHDAAGYLGTRPTFDDGKPVLEVFLFDFDDNLYGRDITVQFIDHIRPDRKFDTAAELIAQMEIDCSNARRVLQGIGPHVEA